MLVIRNKFKYTEKLKVKKENGKICQINTNQNKAGVGTLILK